MEKLTEKEIVEKIKNPDISFLYDVKQYIQNVDKIKELDETYEKEKKLTDILDGELKKYRTETRQITANLKEIFDKYFILEENIKSVYVGNGSYIYGHRDPDDYDLIADDKLFMGDHCLAKNRELHSTVIREICIEHFHKIIEIATKTKAEMEEAKQQYDEFIQNADVADYNNFAKQLEEVKQQKGFGAKIKAKRIESEMERLCVKHHIVQQYVDLIKYFDIDLYNGLAEVIPQMEEQYSVYDKINIQYKTKEKEFSDSLKYTHDSWYEESETIKKQKRECEKIVQNFEERAEDFKLTQIFAENNDDFKDSRKPLPMIYEEQVDKVFLKDLKNNLKSYNQAYQIAKAESKDFNTLPDKEKMEYYEVAKKVVAINDKYQINNEDEER